MPALSETLTEDVGPLPTWAWAVILFLLVAGYLIYKKKKSMNAQTAQNSGQANASSNLGSVPVSNLTTAAEPMPIQMGDTFVNVPAPTVNQQQTVTERPVDPVRVPTGTLPAPTPTPAPPPPTPSSTPAPAPAPVQPKRTVTVCSWPNWCGSLWGIAEHFYGNGADWPKIYQANKGLIGGNPNLIHPGQTLVIP